MKKFKFTLQTLLDHRENLEEEAKSHLAHEMAVKRELEETRDLLMNEVHSAKEFETVISAEDLQNRMHRLHYASSVMREVVLKQEAIQKQKHNIELAREALVTASQKKRVLEIHKENLKTQWKKERKKFEINFLDEVSSQAFVKKGPS